jgi:hypothetical protein
VHCYCCTHFFAQDPRSKVDRNGPPSQSPTLAQFGSRQCQLCAHPKRPLPSFPFTCPLAPAFHYHSALYRLVERVVLEHLAADGAATSCSPCCFPLFPTRPSNHPKPPVLHAKRTPPKWPQETPLPICPLPFNSVAVARRPCVTTWLFSFQSFGSPLQA